MKTRAAYSLVSGNEAVDRHKMYRVQNAGIMFSNRLNSKKQIRFDVAEVLIDNDGKMSLNYIENAFGKENF